MKTIRIWIAVNKDGISHTYTNRPQLEDGYFKGDFAQVFLPAEYLEEITLENSPRELEIKIL